MNHFTPESGSSRIPARMSAKIRIALICCPTGYQAGGTWRHISSWAAHLNKDRFEIELFLGIIDRINQSKIEKHFHDLGIPCHIISDLYPVSKWVPHGIHALANALALFKPHVLHTVFLQADFLGCLLKYRVGATALVSSWETSIPVPSFCHPLKRLFYRFIFFLLHRRIDRFLAICHATKKETARAFHLNPARIQVLPSGIDLSEFSPREISRKTSDTGAPIVGVISRLSHEKSVDSVIKAAPYILSSIPAVQFIIAGDGPQKSQLEHLARSLGLSQHVHFPGWISNPGRFLDTLDVLVFTSQAEGLPWVILEAQAKSVPVVASNVGGVSEVITDTVNGLLLETLSPAEIAHKVTDILHQREYATEMARKGRHCIESRFTIEREMRDLEHVYLEMSGIQPRKPSRLNI